MPRCLISFSGCVLVASLILPARAEEPQSGSAPRPEAASRPLFDGKSLEGWKITNFGGEGEVYVEDGKLILDHGSPLTGVTYAGKELPKTNYEISLDAARLAGSDFFVGLTFPVGDSHASLILGGWGGGLTGISSINGMDASENETTGYQEFKNGQWHHVRLRVTPDRLAAWVDDKQIVDVNIAGRKISTRVEVDRSKPLGLASYQTRAALKSIKIRRLDP